MSSSRRLAIGVAVVLFAVLAALPFKKQLFEQQDQRAERRSRVRWHQAQASVPTPLEVHAGESPAKELHATPTTGHRTVHDGLENRVSHAVAIGKTPQLPRIPEAYQPLLTPAPATSARPVPSRENTAISPSGTLLSDSKVGSKDGGAKPEVRVIRHRIRDGDTLQALAARYLGDPARYREIYESNKDRLPSEEVLPLNLMIEIYVPR